MHFYVQSDFENFLVDNGVVEFRKRKVKLSSGRRSNLYLNARKLMDDVVTFNKLMNFVQHFLYDKKLNPDYFLGVPEGMTKLGLIMTYVKAESEILSDHSILSGENPSKKYPLPMARGKIKKHGSKRDRYFLGSLDGKVVVLEDVLTSGDSVIKLLKNLRDNNAEIEAVVGLVDRLELGKDGLSVAEKMEKEDVTYHSMTDVKTLLPLAYEKLNPSNDLVRKINRYYKKYGCEEVRINS